MRALEAFSLPSPHWLPSQEYVTGPGQPFIGTYWTPQAVDKPGKVQAVSRIPNSYPPELAREANWLARLVHDTPEMGTIYDALGVHTHWQGKGTKPSLIEVTIPHAEAVSDHFAALTKRAGVSAVRFAVYPGALYKSAEFAEALQDDAQILLATEADSKEVGHDIMTHVTGWVYAPDTFVEQAQANAAQALRSGAAALDTFMKRIDTWISTVGVTPQVAKAVRYQNTVRDNPFAANNIDTQWAFAGNTLSYGLHEPRLETGDIFGSALKNRHAALCEAAQSI